MLGKDLQPSLERVGHLVQGFDLPELDITESKQVLTCLNGTRPDIVINCAAYTAVDKAESEPDIAFAVNRDGSANLAEPCGFLDIPLIYLSTDHVFDGHAQRGYREDDPANPPNVYGQSKWAGEEAIRTQLAEHIIVRTSWLYGVHGNNFVKTMLRLSREQEELRVVVDQHGCPTWTGDLAEALVLMIGRICANQTVIRYGTYHFCGGGFTTWYDFAQEILNGDGSRRLPEG
ncbi:MAG: dTDP-4-dehydrorhamnose reductase [candidate division Zixibacteria bacterium]|nr:dTDP-4-dehydrorhamnose reductase [candidate division Zixibacteria bacterium]